MNSFIASTCIAQQSELSAPLEIILRRSYTQLLIPLLRDRNPEAALQAFDGLIDQTLPLGDLVYSDLPSAAAALHRSLAQQDSGDVYEWLSTWTLPTAERQRIRLLTVPVPIDAPPKVFARSIGERPRETTFAVAAVGPVEGLWCSGWMWLRAANDLGQLPAVRVKLKGMVDSQVAGAEQLHVLSQLVGTRGDFALANAYLQKQSTVTGEATPLTPSDINDAAIAAAATEYPETQAAAEELLASMIERATDDDAVNLRPMLRIAHAVAVQSHRGKSPSTVLFENRLKHWIPVTVRSAKAIERGQRSGVWLTHEQHVLHLAGGTADILLCRYPFTGAFDFICETQEGGAIGTDGGLVYGGVQFQALGRTDQLTVWDADAKQAVTRTAPFARSGTSPVFNHVSIRSSEAASQFESNFHALWLDEQTSLASPWLGLRSSGTKRPVFRNIRLTGKPQIPRQIELITSDQLRGWMSGFYEESQPPTRDSRMAPTVEGAAEAKPVFDWRVEGDRIIAAKQTTPAEAGKPGLLQYQRPLLEDESITYEFLHQDESSIVHPAVGRLAFLFEAGGVRLRWITTGQSEWTGLPIDNAALEPLNRRGPRTLPLKQEAWNQVRVQRTDGELLIHLNSELIYQRPLEPNADTTFGLYRTARSHEASIRSIIMAGNWPDTVPEDFLADPLTTDIANAP
jgi:hypothetical protein